MNNNTGKYDDIIKLPHHVSKKHPQMSLEARSAQFAPFSPLTGYEDAVHEMARLTSDRIEIEEDVKLILNNKLKKLQEQINNKPTVTFTYFIPDVKKDGGKYITVTGNVEKIDKYRKLIILENKTAIPISEIIEIEGDILKIRNIEE